MLLLLLEIPQVSELDELETVVGALHNGSMNYAGTGTY
jgi:hypothetical protein